MEQAKLFLELLTEKLPSEKNHNLTIVDGELYINIYHDNMWYSARIVYPFNLHKDIDSIVAWFNEN